MGIITLISASVAATGLAVGLAVGGVQLASAAAAPPAAAPRAAAPPAGVPVAATPADITLPSGGVLEQRLTRFCQRVPHLITRAEKAQARLTAGPTTRGSLAWLKARQAKVEKNGRTRIAHRLDRVIERRTDRLAKLPEVKQRLATAQSECATLDLPDPTSSPEPSTS